MNYFITGAIGFVDGWVTHQLAEEGFAPRPLRMGIKRTLEHEMKSLEMEMTA